MLKQNRTNVSGTIGDFVNSLVDNQDAGTEQEKVYKALSIMERNGMIGSAQVEKFKQEYANGDFIVEPSRQER